MCDSMDDPGLLGEFRALSLNTFEPKKQREEEKTQEDKSDKLKQSP